MRRESSTQLVNENTFKICSRPSIQLNIAQVPGLRLGLQKVRNDCYRPRLKKCEKWSSDLCSHSPNIGKQWLCVTSHHEKALLLRESQ